MTTSLNEFIGQEMLWQPTAAMKARYELVAGNQMVASFDMSNWGSSSIAQTPDGIFSIKRDGVFKPRVNVRAGSEAGTMLASFKQNWSSGGDLQFTDGRTFTLRKTNFWGSKKAWLDATGQIIMTFQAKSFSRTVGVSVAPEAAVFPDLPLLAALGLYIIILIKREAAAATAAST